MELFVYHSRANGLAEKDDTSQHIKGQGKTPVQLILQHSDYQYSEIWACANSFYSSQRYYKYELIFVSFQS